MQIDHQLVPPKYLPDTKVITDLVVDAGHRGRRLARVR